MLFSFTRSITFSRVVRLAGEHKATVAGCCHFLFEHVSICHPDGCIPDCTDAEVEEVCQWPGQAGRFVSALIEAEVVRREGRALHVCDWFDMAPDFAKRKARRRKKDEPPSPALPFSADGAPSENAVGTMPTRVPQRGESSKEQIARQGAVAAAVPTADAPSPAAPAAAVLGALTEAGIGEPVRSELARSGLTAEHVRETHARLAAKGQGNGTLVNQLRVDGPQIRARTHAEAARRLNVLQREQISLWSDEAFEAHLRREWPALVKRLPQLAGCWPPGRAPDRAALCEFPSVIEALVKNRSPPVRGELTAES